ncbi:peptidylprolyl isomerase [Sphingomonas sp. RB1R13]|uniref:peptidylprolyl isomerase n=1 Tax=Sphingomonas sp. RB1R13 TaxID=3096159 RepID=UPI002FC66D00
MMCRFLVAVALAAVSLNGAGVAQVAAPVSVAPAPAPKADIVKVAIVTSKGRMVIALDRGHAPITVANFLHYVDTKRYDRQSFYRAMPYDKGGLIQAGITSNAKLLFKPIAHEPTSVTGLRNVRGTISMARIEPGSARSDFFILTEDIPGFDDDVADPGFAAFGSVVEGMDVADKIFHAPVSPTRGVGAMKGQMLAPAVKILRAVRVK